MTSLSESTPWARKQTDRPAPSWLARLSEASRTELAHARDEALRLWRVALPEPEHLLLSLLAGRDPAVRKLLPEAAELTRIRARAEETVLREKPQVFYLRDAVTVELAGEFSLTPRLHAVLERAAAAAGGPIEPVHLLRALPEEGSGSAAVLLREVESAAGETRETQRGGGEFAPVLDAASELPIREQVVRQVEEAVATGALAPGGRLPSVRRLADRLEVAPGTVAGAYAELERRGVVVTEGPRGTRVAEPPRRRGPDERRGGELAEMLRPAVVAAFHRGAGADELRRALEAAMRGIFP